MINLKVYNKGYIMIETQYLYNCEQCHLLFYRERIGNKPGPAVTECPECSNPWAHLWPEVTSGYGGKKPWPEMPIAQCIWSLLLGGSVNRYNP